MKLHHILSYGLMTVGAAASIKIIQNRTAWEQGNTQVGIVLDWDDVQAVLTRALTKETLNHLLSHFREHGATHLSIPEITLQYLLDQGKLSVVAGGELRQITLQAQTSALAEWIVAELQARLPRLTASSIVGESTQVTFVGDWPAVAEVGLGFDPHHFALAVEAGLVPVARPIGYSWVQPTMVERTLDQAAQLGAKIVAVQGTMTPGFEFYLDTTIEAFKRNKLYYAYFRESRHQRGDWGLAKSLVETQQVLLAHEFSPEVLLLEDNDTISRRWANLAIEGGIRLCCLRFFRMIHAGDPMEALDYVTQLTGALTKVGMVISSTPEVNLQLDLPVPDEQMLSTVGVGIAGAAGLAADFLPISSSLKLLGMGASAVALASLPNLEKQVLLSGDEHDHEHHKPDHKHHHHHNHELDHGHHHHHGEHSHGPPPKTAYASKGLALAASIVYPMAAVSQQPNVVEALAQATMSSIAGAASVNATLSEEDYLLGVEEYRGLHLDWFLPMAVVVINTLLKRRVRGRWLPFMLLLGIASRYLRSPYPDPLAPLDREHHHGHTHHISAFQQRLGDAKLALSLQPLRKWAMLVPLGSVSAALFRQRGRPVSAALAVMITMLGSIVSLAGFRNLQRPFHYTAVGRLRGWKLGGVLALVVWVLSWLCPSRRCK